MIGTGAIVGRFILICSLALMSWVVLYPRQCAVGVHALPPGIEDAAFGINTMADDGSAQFVETSHIPLVPGTTFGWRLKLTMPDSSMMLREEFILPAPPTYWGVSSDTILSDDRMVAITERLVTPENGWLDGRWTVTPGDPEGPYQLRVFLDGTLVKTFRVTAE
jgi:hypothetical protein